MNFSTQGGRTDVEHEPAEHGHAQQEEDESEARHFIGRVRMYSEI